MMKFAPDPFGTTSSPADGVGGTAFDLAMQWVDDLLRRSIDRMAHRVGVEANSDLFRGLHIPRTDVDRLLQNEPKAHELDSNANADLTPLIQFVHADSRLSWLAHHHELDAFEVGVFLIALAPEIDLKYESLYAFIQDNVMARQPRVDLVLSLFCANAEQRMHALRHFAPHAPLFRHRLLHLHAASQRSDTPLLAHTLNVDGQIRDWWLSLSGLDRRLESVASLTFHRATIEKLPFAESFKAGLRAVFASAPAGQAPRLFLHGRRTREMCRIAEACAGSLEVSILRTSLKAGLDTSLIDVLFREGSLQGALLLIEDWDFAGQAPDLIRRWLEAVENYRGPVVLLGSEVRTEWESRIENLLMIPLPALDVPERRSVWRTELAAQCLTLDEPVLAELSERFRLSPSQIERTVRSVRSHVAFRRGAADPADTIDTDDWFAAVRAQCGHELAPLAQRISPMARWDHLVLPADAATQLRELCQRVRGQFRVLKEWGFATRLTGGKGVNALFSGPSGTGKSMAAEVIANELGLELYRIELASIVSKWLGETEKNLDRVFDTAEDANAVLFFDEADALFGKRSEVNDAHDRYANLEISYLLQKMESFEGVTILATNLRQNLDEAFVRRLTFNIVFPFPDDAQRRRIWKTIWPAETPLADEVDLDHLAKQYRLSGGNIKNVALAAAFLAADEDIPVQQRHLLHAIEREYQKMGKTLSSSERNGVRKEVMI